MRLGSFPNASWVSLLARTSLGATVSDRVQSTPIRHSEPVFAPQARGYDKAGSRRLRKRRERSCSVAEFPAFVAEGDFGRVGTSQSRRRRPAGQPRVPRPREGRRGPVPLGREDERNVFVHRTDLPATDLLVPWARPHP